MIICPSCKTENVENTLFCTECGGYLSDDQSPMTDAVGMPVEEWMASPGEEDLDISPPGTGPLAISLEIGDVKRALQIPLTKPIHMGRIDPGGNIFPEVDLTNDGGAERGVSRRHARIMKREQQIYIEDLGSSNGTFVNGQKLMPYFPELLSDGDALMLGKLQIRISLKLS